MRKPIVSTSVGDVPIYVENHINGFVVDVGDIENGKSSSKLYFGPQAPV